MTFTAGSVSKTSIERMHNLWFCINLDARMVPIVHNVLQPPTALFFKIAEWLVGFNKRQCTNNFLLIPHDITGFSESDSCHTPPPMMLGF